MKNLFVLFAVTAGMAVPAGAQNFTLQKTAPIEKQIVLQKQKAGGKVLESRSVAKGINDCVVELPNGQKMRTVMGLPEQGKVLDPQRVAPRAASVREGFVLYEDFEAWDSSNAAWLPDGWTIDHKDSPASNRGWKMTEPLNPYDYISSKCLTYELFDDEVDEWVMTPEFTVSLGMELCWETMTGPYFYDWAYLDGTTYQLTQYEIINDIKVNISTDGGATWTTLFSHAENLRDTAESFFAMFNFKMMPFKLSLNRYFGKTVKIGFQIVGREGNTTYLDNVSVGLPPTQTSYVRPLSNLFFGLSSTDENVPASIMVGPVYKPMTFSNTTSTKNADFTWTYADDNSGELKTSNEKNLTVTYKTDYTSASTTRNNMYDYPVLSGSSSATSPDEFTYPGFLQAGGKGEYERHYIDTDEYEVIDLGLTVIDPVIEGSATYADIALPFFGYNSESDRYWSDYSFGEYSDENNWAHLEKYGDFFYTPETPLVIKGVRTIAYGKVSRNAKFTAEVYFLNAGFVIPDEPNVKAVCTGNDITIIDRYSSSDILSLNFTFDEPIVVTRAEVPYFVVAIGGFRDAENVEYFSPEMSAYGNPNNLGLGWLCKELCFNGELLPMSWSSVSSFVENEELVSFYIMLDAVFPWLEGGEEEVTVSPDTPATITFDCYYDASELTVEGLPEWLKAEAAGRYGETKVTLSAENVPADNNVDEITIKAPGVSKVVKVSHKGSGVSLIEAGATGEAAVYTLTGQRVAADNAAPGIYIVRRADGTASKIVKR